MSRVELRDITKKFGDNTVIPQLNLTIPNGQLTVLLGPSGCGKSTLLRLIAGLEYPDQGRILVDGEDITQAEPRKRNVAMVFQNYALYPHLTVRQNLAFPLEIAKVDRSEVEPRVRSTVELLGLSAMLDRLPRTLSGGERQRTAVGRAIIRDPKLFLFDEPLSNLDFQLRNQMRGEIKAIQKRLGKTMIYVTHDQTEAMTMADTLVVLERGRIMQQGTPDEVYHRPANIFTARFIGSPPINILRASVKGNQLRLESVDASICSVSVPDGDYLIGIRPDDLTVSAGNEGIPMNVDRTEFHGATTYLHGRIGEQEVVARGGHAGGQIYLQSEMLSINLAAQVLHFFDVNSQQRQRF